MNTNTIIGIVVAVIVIGGGIFLVTRGNKSESATATTSQTSQQATPGKYSGSIYELSKRGGSWQCKVDTSSNQAVASGTVYVSGNNVRADYSVTVPSYGNMEAHLIVTGGETYSWSSMINRGVKTKLVATSQGGAETSGQGVNANTAYSYDCQPWTADNSKFAVPSTITFTEVE